MVAAILPGCNLGHWAYRYHCPKWQTDDIATITVYDTASKTMVATIVSGCNLGCWADWYQCPKLQPDKITAVALCETQIKNLLGRPTFTLIASNFSRIMVGMFSLG